MRLTKQSVSAFLVLCSLGATGVHSENIDSGGKKRGDQMRRKLPGKGKGTGKGKGGLITEKIFDRNPTKFAEETIDCDLTLTEDVDCTYLTGADVCLRLASGVTLDCNGYTIKGPGPDGASPWTVGIQTENIDAGDTTTIKNCNIEGFDFCVLATDSSRLADNSPIFFNEIRPTNPDPAGTCEGLGFPAGTKQCCPGKDSIDGVARVETTKASGCFYGYLTQLVNVEFFDVIATENTSRGFQFQICSDVSLEEIYACKNGQDDIRYNDAFENSDYISAATGTIRADVLTENASGDSPGPLATINTLLSPEAIQNCFVEDACGTAIL